MKQTKKGFTLVELLVVIAILAILATVSVVGYTSFIMKANLSNDQAFVAQANITLQAGAIPNGFNSASEAINELNRNGFAGKYNTYSSGYHYAYSLANNKMYLVNDKNEVVYPEVVDISTLWGLYNDDRTSYVQGITNYVAMANITNEPHFNDVFASGTYTIDLNGHFIDVDATNAQITASNGIIINGATAGEGINTGYTLVSEAFEGSDSFKATHGTKVGNEWVIKDRIFTQFLNPYFKGEDIKFVNCIFYNDGAVYIGDKDDTNNTVTFESCKFMDLSGKHWGILTYASLVVKDCSFIGLGERGAIQVQPYYQGVSVEITGCTFDGVNAERPIIRFVSGNGTVATANISGCTFQALNGANFIIGYDTADTTVTAGTTWTFSNNTVATSIPQDKYIQGGDSGNSDLKNKFESSLK